MKILFVTSQSDRPESALALGLAERGHQLVYVGKPHADFMDSLVQRNVEFRDLNFKSRFDLPASRELGKIITDFKPDLVHAFNARALAGAIRCHNDNFKIITYRGTTGHLSRLDPSCLASFFHPKVDAVSCVSNAVKQYLLDKDIPDSKLFTIYKGHDPKWYQVHSKLTRQEFEISNNAYLVVCVANARPVKGLDVLLQASNLLSKEENIKFLVVGEIRNQELLKSNKNPNLKFLGFRSDAQNIVCLANLLVVPSRGREGLPKSLLEAIAQKVPVIASRVGGIPEVVTPEQEGLLVPPNDPIILMKAIAHLFANQRTATEYANKAYLRLLKQLSVEVMVEKTEKMYQKVLSAQK